MADSRLLYCILIEVSLNEIAIDPLQLIYFSDVSVNMVSSELTWVSGSILQIEPDTKLNLIAFRPQQSLYLVSNQNVAGEI